jgi:hypothetical protein
MRDGMADCGMARPRRQKSFETWSFSTALSSICSANSFFSRRFSSSSERSRLASEASSPPYLAFHLKKVVPLVPWRRQRSCVFAPASCSFRMPMIYSSVNRLLLIVDLLAIDSTITWREFRGAGHPFFPEIADTNEQPKRSAIVVREGSRLLVLGHRAIGDIAQNGGGRYSHYMGAVFFLRRTIQIQMLMVDSARSSAC